MKIAMMKMIAALLGLGSALAAHPAVTAPPGSCSTSASGQCAVSQSGIPMKTATVRFVVVNVTHATLTDRPASNHDADGGGGEVIRFQP